MNLNEYTDEEIELLKKFGLAGRPDFKYKES